MQLYLNYCKVTINCTIRVKFFRKFYQSKIKMFTKNAYLYILSAKCQQYPGLNVLDLYGTCHLAMGLLSRWQRFPDLHRLDIDPTWNGSMCNWWSIWGFLPCWYSDDALSWCFHNSFKVWSPVDESTNAWSSNEIQRHDLKIGHQDSSPSNGCQGDMSP